MPGHTGRDDRDRAVAADVQLGQRTGEIGSAVCDGFRRRRVGAGVMHHHPADVRELAVTAAAPPGELDDVEAFGTKRVGQPQRGTARHHGLWHAVTLQTVIANRAAGQP
jgi:hypothetical protein